MRLKRERLEVLGDKIIVKFMNLLGGLQTIGFYLESVYKCGRISKSMST